MFFSSSISFVSLARSRSLSISRSLTLSPSLSPRSLSASLYSHCLHFSSSFASSSTPVLLLSPLVRTLSSSFSLLRPTPPSFSLSFLPLQSLPPHVSHSSLLLPFPSTSEAHSNYMARLEVKTLRQLWKKDKTTKKTKNCARNLLIFSVFFIRIRLFHRPK